MLQDMLGIEMQYTKLPSRQSDQKVFVADIKKIRDRIGWVPNVSAREGIASMIDWVKRR